MTIRSKTRTIDSNAKAPTRELATPRAPTREAINRKRRGGGSYAVLNKKKGQGGGVEVSALKTADGNIQLATGDHTVSLTLGEAHQLAQKLLRVVKSESGSAG